MSFLMLFARRCSSAWRAAQSPERCVERRSKCPHDTGGEPDARGTEEHEVIQERASIAKQGKRPRRRGGRG
eukprot:3281734-Pyramimonas_sp.AAC.1